MGPCEDWQENFEKVEVHFFVRKRTSSFPKLGLETYLAKSANVTLKLNGTCNLAVREYCTVVK